MKTSKEKIRQEQELRKELFRVGYRDQLNQLATKLQISEGIKPVQAIHQATLEVAAVAVKDGEMSASLLPGSAVKPGRAVIKRTPVKASTPAKPKADLYILPGGNLGMRPKSSGIRDYKAIRQAGILAAQTLKAAKESAGKVLAATRAQLWGQYASIPGTDANARRNFYNANLKGI